MAVKRYCSLFFAGLVVFSGMAAQAQSNLTVEKNRLARLEQSLENRQVELEDIENELLSYEYKLERAQESLNELRKEYEASRVELEEARRLHESNGTSDSERRLTKAKHGFAMAERGVDSRSRRLEFIKVNHQELLARLDEEKKGIAETKAKVSAQQDKISQVVDSMLAKAEASERRAALAKSAKAEAAKPKPPKLKTAAIEKPQKRQVQPEPVPTVKRDIDPELLAYVKREQKRLSLLLSDKEGENKQTFRNLLLKPSSGGRQPFEFLGKNQYRLVATVHAGRQTYKINTWKFRRTIPAEDDGERYVFIFDARRLSRPRLVMYPEYVLDALK
ncbi:hypothetical protein MJO52_07765 [Microbulbifer variabilis]|uniref:Uncharacterized protein n=1 Tax=Microbulbifer variabilis TaxID=266805 RepID=A0ABY4VFG0_9GAMM|nr:hypothetical protein [Microbulbifer variabilis]USD23017.1 hypothetical protein MJO52_07765 [Microbulbifer variabilis]